MELSWLGPISLKGFQHAWSFLSFAVIVAVAVWYLLLQRSRKRRVMRFANMELLESVAPQRSHRFRHLPAVLLLIAMSLFTIAIAGPTHDVRIPRNRAVAESDSHASATMFPSSLSKKQQEILFLRTAGLTSAQTGEALGMSAGAVRVAMHRALAKRRAEQQSGATQDTAKLGMADVDKISPFLSSS